MIMSRVLPLPHSSVAAGGGQLRAALHHGANGLARLGATAAQTTPFQSPGWLGAFLEAHSTMDAFRLIEIADGHGNALLLPLTIIKQAGLSIATKVGGAHASFFVPARVGDPSVWSAASLHAALMEAGRSGGIDAFLIADSPQTWGGSVNSFARLPHQPSPSDGAILTIDAPGEALLDRLFDRDHRKKQRYKRRKLDEIGHLRSGWAPCDGSVEAALSAFRGWKARQFSTLGIADPFASIEIQAFLHAICCGENPTARIFVLYLDERPIAIVGTAQADRHVSGMFTAYDPDPEIARFSPGDVLMADLILTLCAEGVRSFDLGVGEARYKSHFCPENLPLVDLAQGVSGSGRIAALIWRAMRRAKRAIKQNPAAYDFAKRFRRRLAT